jgi:hypothetical protein
MQDNMNSVRVVLVASTEVLLLPLKTEWLVAGMGTNLFVISYYEWTSDGFWSFVGLYSAKHCAHYAHKKKSYQRFCKT